MSITEQEVIKIAKLARIGLSHNDKTIFAGELSNILTMVEQLSAINTENIEPLRSVISNPLPMREDMVSDGNCTQEVMKNAHNAEYNCFVVPKVIE